MLASSSWFCADRSTSTRVRSRFPARVARSAICWSRRSPAFTVRMAGSNRRIMNSSKVCRPSNRSSRITSTRWCTSAS